MLAIEVEYLLGRAVATDPSQRDRAEWPPHPTRLFSALVDALGDLSESDARARAEAALRWIEAEPPPEISVSLDDDASARTVVKHFVPVNDELAEAKSMRPTPLTDLRPRQERFFPAVAPGDPRVVFSWASSAPSETHFGALSDLAARVPYLGHSSSVVRIACKQESPPPTITPALGGDYLLRVPGRGRLDRLNAVYEARKQDTYVQPPKGKEVWYVRAGDRPAAQGPHGDMRVVAFEGSRFGLTETAWVTARFRAALLSKIGSRATAPEILSGHHESGRPSQRPHIAFVPLANVAHAEGKFSDGAIKGLGVLIPRDCDERSMTVLEAALAAMQRLVFGPRGEVELRSRASDGTRSPESSGRLYSLDERRYSRAARTWATVTPIVLGLHPKGRGRLTAEAIVARHVRELGLPEPVAIALHRQSEVRGVDEARAFHRGGISALRGRPLWHAVIRFAEPVAGPLVVGAGRYMGFGLLLPRREAR